MWRGGRRARRWWLLGAVTALLLASGGVALAAYPQGAPNDPDYNPVERGAPASCTQQSVNNEQYYFYSFIPKCTQPPFGNAHDPEGAAGMSIDKAWSQYTTGSPSTVLAYVEGGINWHGSDARDLADKVFINRGELPLPEDSQGHTNGAYDRNHDGVFNAADYAHDPRVHDANHNHLVDPEDLIVAFSNHTDSDHNGFVDDISGWDFYDHQNDPATEDSTYGHANSQQRQAAAQTNNGFDGAGVCPRCLIMPVKAGAEALDRTDDLAQAWLYAGEVMHAKVIISVTADLGYSSYMRQAIERLWRDGVVMVEASNDFDSLDHQGGMFWPHVIPGNGLVTNTKGFEMAPGGQSNALTTTFRTRSDQTSFGTHALFSVSTQGGSTSTSTPTTGGIFGLLLSYGAKIGRPLTNDEAVQVFRATASDIADPHLAWPGRPGWDVQYGYGRPNVYRAMTAVAQGNIPPVGWIQSPDWYALYDPAHTDTVTVSGHVAAPRSSHYRWRLEYGLGPEPTTFHTIGTGSGTKPRDGVLGRLPLSKIPRSFQTAPFRLSSTKALETNDKYTVTLRLRVYDARNRMGEDRRAIAVRHDASMLPNFPRRIGPGGASQPALVDLQGRGHLAAVFGDADGRIHAIDGKSGRELPGFPVLTNRTRPEHSYTGIDPGHEPVIAPVAVGDLDHDGRLDIVATSTTGRVYVFDSRGRRRAGWPKALDTGLSPTAIPRPALPYTRLSHLGATAPPVLYPLEGGHRLDIVQSAWDGRIHVWRPDGVRVPGWPRHVELPAGHQPRAPEKFTVHDFKLDTPPAIADLDGDGRPELVQRSQETDILSGGIQPGGVAYVFAYHAGGEPVAGFPSALQGIVEYFGSAQEFITEGASVPAAADVDGDGKDEVAAGPIFSPTYLIRGDGSALPAYGPNPGNPFAGIASGRLDPTSIINGNPPTDVPISFTTAGAFGRVGGTLAYAQPGSGAASTAIALLLTGSGFGIQNYERVYQAGAGAPLPGYPTKIQGLDFLGAPLVADVSGDGRGDVITAGDSSSISGTGTGGRQASGFPKFTTGWVLFSPTTGDLTSNGRTDLVTTTREGYLEAWSTAGRAAAGNDEWWSYHHDEWRTGRYGVDTRPPGVLRDATLGSGRLRFTAPGDDWYAGRVTYYRVSANGRTRRVASTRAAGGRESIAEPTGARRVTVQAVDDAGNLSPPVVVSRRGGGGPSGGGHGAHQPTGGRARSPRGGVEAGEGGAASAGRGPAREDGAASAGRGPAGASVAAVPALAAAGVDCWRARRRR